MKLKTITILFLYFAIRAEAGQFSLFAENDLVYHTDEFYTHGTRLQYITDNDLGVAIGQNMYTPTDITIKELIPNDRPYAGWLYFSTFVDVLPYWGGELFIENQIGMTGHDSFADDTQTLIHKWIHSRIPKGWNNQIPNHFGELLMGKYTYSLIGNKYFAIDPYIGAGVGNIVDYANHGILVYLGYNLPKNRNLTRTISFKVAENTGWNPYAYVYGGSELKYMAYNMLLSDSRFTIHPNDMIIDKLSGVVVGCRYVELAFTLCYRSKEFIEQEKDERFGSAKISINF